jgi:hypothetical protein
MTSIDHGEMSVERGSFSTPTAGGMSQLTTCAVAPSVTIVRGNSLQFYSGRRKTAQRNRQQHSRVELVVKLLLGVAGGVLRMLAVAVVQECQ